MTTERLSALTDRQVQEIATLDFCRFLQCLHETGGPLTAAKAFTERFPRSFNADLMTHFDVEVHQKAAIPPGMSTDASWAQPLAAPGVLIQAFVAFVNTQTIVGRLPRLTRAPFNATVPVLTAGGTYNWIGEGNPKPATALAFASAVVPPAKAGGLLAVSAELLKLQPGTAELLRSVLAAGLARFLDQTFMDPAVTAAPSRPASITNGATLVPSTGDLKADLAALVDTFFAAHTPIAPAFVLPSEVAVQLGLGGAQDVRVDAIGYVAGVPAIVSPHTRVVALIDQQAVLVADNGEIQVDTLRHASVQMDSAPANPADATTVYVSFWQNNLIGVLAERLISWLRPQATSVAYFVPGTP